MLTFARKQELKLEAVDVVATVHGMADMLERTMGVGIAIDTHFPLVLKPVLADQAQLELALMNLVVNARDAMPGGGTIEISASEHKDEAGAPFVHLAVTDSGEGMDSVTLGRAVEPFFTTKGIGKGTGLGLSMVQGMAEQVGGRLVVDSTPGTGTRAEIVLPVADEERAATPPAELPALSGGKLTILAVDDDPIVLLNTVALLEDLGHEVLQAASGKAALAILSEREVDLLLTDFAMPHMTGTELADKARELRPTLKVIVASGYADLPDGSAITGRRLSKPFSDSQLAACIARVAG